MKIREIAGAALLLAVVAGPVGAIAQETHEDAVAQQTQSDHHHHTKAKIVGGSAAGGAVTGAAVGGPVGAAVGAGVGATGGVVANKIRKHHDVKEREKYGTPTEN